MIRFSSVISSCLYCISELKAWQVLCTADASWSTGKRSCCMMWPKNKTSKIKNRSIKLFTSKLLSIVNLAEWLRRQTWNLLGFPRAGSNPAVDVSSALKVVPFEPEAHLKWPLFHFKADLELQCKIILSKLGKVGKDGYKDVVGHICCWWTYFMSCLNSWMCSLSLDAHDHWINIYSFKSVFKKCNKVMLPL